MLPERLSEERGDGEQRSGELPSWSAAQAFPGSEWLVRLPALLTSMDAPKAETSLITNSIQAYMHITSNPEKAALYFITGVCFGLILTLCLLVIRISCHARTETAGPASKRAEEGSEDEDEDEDEEEDEEEEAVVNNGGSPTATDLGQVNNGQAGQASPGVNVFTSAEELERAQLLEERERIIREIWRSGQPDVLGSGWHQFEMEMLPNGGQREHRTWSPNSHGKY